MARGKDGFFVVVKGRQTGIFEGWLQTSPLVNKFSGNEYKSYNTLEEAQEAWDRAMRKQDPNAIEDEDGDIADVLSAFNNVHIATAPSPQYAGLASSSSPAVPVASRRTTAFAANSVSPSPSRASRSPASAYPASPSPSRAPRSPAAAYPASPSQPAAATASGASRSSARQAYTSGASSSGRSLSLQPVASGSNVAPPLTREDIDSAPDGDLWYAVVRGHEEGVFPGPLTNIREKIINFDNTFFRGFQSIEDAGEWFVEHFAD
ncbi:hypothetical protein BV25DRAFT_1918620 [Artomyces pyxidatus]|uniref:Uncharacterized protein n=1 Tax=Artomyces pyxidatus TaxID=48021 RepID=A0ACB8ST54_9AGAM|nr:hypothetical protein BV25DRAFT_1918620 [Artomyces pyxidatus]